MPQSLDSYRFSASRLHWGHRSPDTLKIPLPTPLKSFIIAWGSVSDCHTYVGFRCSKKVEKHCDNIWKSKLMALEKPRKCRQFFLLFCGHLEMHHRTCHSFCQYWCFYHEFVLCFKFDDTVITPLLVNTNFLKLFLMLWLTEMHMIGIYSPQVSLEESCTING